MNTKFEIKGYWWLPETPETQIPGILSFSPSEPSSLELMGALKKADIKHSFINPSIIHGMSLEGKPITLQDCMQVKNNERLIGTSTGITSTGFSIYSVYNGVHFSDNKEIRFRGVSVSFYNLDEWFSKMGFNTQDRKSGSIVATYKQPVPIKTTIGDYHIDFIVVGPNTSQDHFTHVNLSQEARINIWADSEKDIEDFLTLIRHVQNFLTLAMSNPTFVIEVVGTTESAKEENPIFYSPVEIYYPAHGWRPDPSEANHFEMRFTLPTVEEELEKILENWITKAEIIKPVYDLYFSALYNPSIYQEFHFLSLAQAIETYHRQIYGGKYQPDDEFRDGLYKILVAAIPNDIPDKFRNSLKQGKLKYANEYSLHKRLELLGEHLANNLNISFLNSKNLRESFADKVRCTRNYFTHYSQEDKDKAAQGGKELSDLNRKLRLILQICLLEQLGFSFDKITEMFKRSIVYDNYFF